MQCAGSANCFAAFHPLCARAAGFAVAIVDAEEDDAADADGLETAGSGDSDRENRDANAAGAGSIRLLLFVKQCLPAEAQDVETRKGLPGPIFVYQPWNAL